MRNLSFLLEKFSNSLNKNVFVKETIIKIIENKTLVKLKSKDINLRDGVLEIIASAVAKNEIKLKEPLILNEFKTGGIPVVKLVFR